MNYYPSDTAEHVCACSHCDPFLRVDLAEATNHFGVHFPGHAIRLKVFKGDEDISHSCWQVIAGAPGTAWRFTLPLHTCKTCDLHGHVCAYLDQGDFTVVGPADTQHFEVNK